MGTRFVHLLNDLELSEPQVDCGACRVHPPLERDESPRPMKCCTYQPFWSALLIGERLLARKPMPRFPENAVFLPVGVVPDPSLRQQQEVLPPRVRAVEPSMLCPYATRPRISCSIFEHRPLECRRYFCASQSESHSRHRESVFSWSQSLQAEVLRKVLMSHQVYTSEDWEAWTAYLDNPGWRLVPTKPFNTEESAMEFYRSLAGSAAEFFAGVEPPNFSVLLEKDNAKKARTYGRYHRNTPTEIG